MARIMLAFFAGANWALRLEAGNLQSPHLSNAYFAVCVLIRVAMPRFAALRVASRFELDFVSFTVKKNHPKQLCNASARSVQTSLPNTGTGLRA